MENGIRGLEFAVAVFAFVAAVCFTRHVLCECEVLYAATAQNLFEDRTVTVHTVQ